MKKKLFYFLLYGVLFLGIYKFRLEIQLLFEQTALWLFPSNKDRNGEFLKVVLTVIGGIGVLYSLHLAYRRLKATNISLELQASAINKQSEQLELSRKGQVDERFKNAVEHLGNDKEPIILGGIVELHQIAKEDKQKYASVVFNILTSFLRSTLKVNVPREDNFSAAIPQTIIDFLFREDDKILYKGFKANLGHCNFKSLDINGSEFIGGDFSFSLMPMYIVDVNFENAKFGRTEFTIGRISNTNFKNTDLHDNLFNLCEFNNVDFFGSKLKSQLFMNTQFNECNFNSSDIYNSNFLLCHFHNVTFLGAELFKINFWGSNFINSNFSKNETFSDVDFLGSGFHETTFGSDCFKCNFSGVGTKFSFNFIQLKDLQKNIGKSVNRTGIKELQGNDFLECDWNEFSEIDYDKIAQKYTTAAEVWKEKYKPKVKNEI